MLKSLRLTNVGPAPTMELDFGRRLNLLTGDPAAVWDGLPGEGEWRVVRASEAAVEEDVSIRR